MIWQTKKLGEIETLIKFIKNKKGVFNESNLNANPNEPADISYAGIGYQIVNSDFEFQKTINIDKHHESNRRPDDVFRDFILDPVNKKRKYGDSAKGLVLLIDSKTNPPQFFITQELVKTKENFDIGFEEIYFVCSNYTQLIFKK